MEEWLERVYDENASALYGYLLNLTRSREDAEDLLQEIFVKLAHKARRFQSLNPLKPYLFRMAQTAFIDWTRRKQTRTRKHEESAKASEPLFIDDHSEKEEFRQEVDRVMEQLPPEQRAVVHLKLWEDYTFSEIAGILGVSANTVASRYRYGIDKLRAELRSLYQESHE